MKNEKEENIFQKLKKTPRGQSLLFFGGYLFFFIFLMIVARTMGSGLSSDRKYDEAKGYSFSVVNIREENYSYNHSILLDGVTWGYKGNRLGEEERFVLYNNLGTYDYYRKGIDYFNNKSGLWIKSDNPYLFSVFFDIDNIMNLVEKAKLEYKTDYESGKKIYNFMITSTTIHDYLEDVNLDIADDVNEIVCHVDENNLLEKVEFKLNSYCKVVGACSSELNITLEYDEYGEIEEIISPLD